MGQQFYFHCYANGDDVKAFVINESDYRFEFNLIAACACHSGISVLAFSIEESHPHLLLKGSTEQASLFVRIFETSSLQHIRMTRGSGDGVVLNLQLDCLEDQSHLMNVGTYVIIQATKDGKAVMPYDYKWGTGSMYFRQNNHTPIWCYNDEGTFVPPRRWGSLKRYEQRDVINTKYSLPDDWLVCNGLVLPNNYIDVEGFESIYKTHNCFRTFQASGRQKEQEILDRMARNRGVMMEDLEARIICARLCRDKFGKSTARWLSADQRLELAKALRSEYHISARQLATLCRLPAGEIDRYVTIRKW